MKKSIFACLLFITILLVSCLPSQEVMEQPEVNNSKMETQTVPENRGEDRELGEEYTVYQLQDNIESVLKQSVLVWKKEESTPLYSGNGQRTYLIYELEEPINNGKDFYEQFSASHWTGNQYFIDEAMMKQLQPDLKEDQFDNEKEYKEYLLYRSNIEQTTSETTHTVQNGKVLEYQHLNWVFNNGGYWQGSWVDILFIYKVYCSSYFVVLLRPTWDKFTLGVSGSAAKGSDFYANWETVVKSLRKEMLPLADKILENCPIDQNFFEGFPSQQFKESKKFYYYLPKALEWWNLSTKVSVNAIPAKNNDQRILEGIYTIQQVDVAFNNNDAFDIERPLFLDITTFADNKEKDIFVSEKEMGSFLKVGLPLSKSIYSQIRPKFTHNLSIQVSLFTREERGKAPIRPTNYVLFTNNTLVQRGVE